MIMGMEMKTGNEMRTGSRKEWLRGLADDGENRLVTPSHNFPMFKKKEKIIYL